MNTDDTGPGTLRAAIEQADLDSSQDTIVFAPTVTGKIVLSSALPDLSGNIAIVGLGSSELTVARSSAPGTAEFRIFSVPVGAVIAISGLTVTNGGVSVAGSGSGASGGGIQNSGTLSLDDVTISGNTAGAEQANVETIDSIFGNRRGGNISGGNRRNFQSLGHNLFSDKPRVRLGSTDLTKTNPRLDPPADNGGPTLTQIPRRGSRAIGTGVPIATVSTDQRGLPRSQPKATDIGAIELPFVPGPWRASAMVISSKL